MWELQVTVQLGHINYRTLVDMTRSWLQRIGNEIDVVVCKGVVGLYSRV